MQRKYLPVIKKFEQSLPANIKLYKHFDQADNVSLRLTHLGTDFLIAILLVLVTLLPLGTRASLVVMIAIPISLALGLVGLNLFGISLYQLSIVGLVVALGLLVDDSSELILVVINYYKSKRARNASANKNINVLLRTMIGKDPANPKCFIIIAIALS